MRIAILGSGAVGGYYGAKLAQGGHDVTFIARGPHLDAIRGRGLSVKSPLGDFVVRSRAESDPSKIGPVDLVIVAVKSYSNRDALPMLRQLSNASTTVLTLQNGIDSANEVASVVGESATVAGATYVATALEAPGLIVQTGTHRRIAFGEVFNPRPSISDRVANITQAMVDSDIVVEPSADARGAIWEKFVYLSPFAGFTGASRLPIGPLRTEPAIRAQLIEASHEVERVGRADGVEFPSQIFENLVTYLDAIPPDTRSSLLIDLQQGKPIEVEALQGAVVRRGQKVGVPTPIMATLYAVLKPYENGPVDPVRTV
jgi:2-dehydropantoate 2-reductase